MIARAFRKLARIDDTILGRLMAQVNRLAEEAQVNISNLTVRLQRLGLIYLRDGDKKIYRSQDEVMGQGSLF